MSDACGMKTFGKVPAATVAQTSKSASNVGSADATRKAGLETCATNAAASPLNKYVHGFHRREFRALESRRLPHLKIKGGTYFVTFRLADSLPQNILRQFEEEIALEKFPETMPEDERKRERNRKRFRQMELWLDKGTGSCRLKQPVAAEMVVGAMRFFHGDRYELFNWVVMPNHVHVLVKPLGDFGLGEIIKSWKQYTSRRLKVLLDWKEPAFWQIESYDHWVRNEEERARIIHYIHNNPVKAKLCAAPEGWPWSSAAEAVAMPRQRL
jgi:REP element-mobilizing transposase RayT